VFSGTLEEHIPVDIRRVNLDTSDDTQRPRSANGSPCTRDKIANVKQAIQPQARQSPVIIEVEPSPLRFYEVNYQPKS